jgi:hypothetical protein
MFVTGTMIVVAASRNCGDLADFDDHGADGFGRS